jgi:hypothetical protein
MEFGYANLGYIFNTIAMLIFICLIVVSSIHIHHKKKLSTGDFALQTFLPNTIALFLFAIGSWFIITDLIVKNGIEEGVLIPLIVITSAGGIFISFISIILSNLVMYWKA